MSNPEFIYDPNDWEFTWAYDDRDDFTDDVELSPGEIKTYHTLVHSDDCFLANVVLTRDEDGGADETEYRWFNTREEAEAAVGKTPIESLPDALGAECNRIEEDGS